MNLSGWCLSTQWMKKCLTLGKLFNLSSFPFLHLQNNRIKLYLCVFNSKNSWTPSVQSVDLYQEIKYLFSNIWRPSWKMVICFNLCYFLEQWVIFNIRNNFPPKEQDYFGVMCSVFLEKHRQNTDYSFFFFFFFFFYHGGYSRSYHHGRMIK